MNKNLVRRDRDNVFGNYSLNLISSITLNSLAVNDNEVITKAYVDHIHNENGRNRRDVELGFYNESNDLVKNNQNNDFINNEITNVKSIEINDTPIKDNHVSNKKYVNDNFILKTDTTIVKNNQNNAFNNNWLFDLESIYLNEDPKFSKTSNHKTKYG